MVVWRVCTWGVCLASPPMCMCVYVYLCVCVGGVGAYVCMHTKWFTKCGYVFFLFSLSLSLFFSQARALSHSLPASLPLYHSLTPPCLPLFLPPSLPPYLPPCVSLLKNVDVVTVRVWDHKGMVSQGCGITRVSIAWRYCGNIP